MKNSITILSVKNAKQVAEINGKKYEFEFSEKELAESISLNTSINDLEYITGLNGDDYNAIDMAEIISSDWNYENVEQLISDFITENQDNLIDHLIESK